MLHSKCEHQNPPGAKFCLECGSPIARRCPACGIEAPPTAKFCGQCGAEFVDSRRSKVERPTPAFDSSTLDSSTSSGERRQLTVLFSDLVGSTELSTQLDPEEWRDIVARYHRTATEVVTRFGGHVAKYLGDGVLALFGYPQAHEDDAERAVRAGLAMAEGVKGLGGWGLGKEIDPPLTPRPLTPHPLSVRVGIHTGLTVIADIGGKADVFGETPNIAARVQSAAVPDTVVVSAATQRLVAGLFVVEERGAQQLKGVPESVTLYRVVQPSGVRSRLEVSVGRHTPFVGRQTELGVLADAWERVVEGMGQTVLVQGEAGIGKSRLCYQLRERLTGEPHTWLECRCSLYTSGTAFRPVTELVEQALIFQPTDTPAEKLGKLNVGLARGGFATDEAGPLLAEWLELPESAGYSALQMSPDFKRRKTLETLAAWNLKLGELQPLVLLVEDLHWCDPSSLELLGRLVAQSATARVLLVGTARPEFSSPWPARSNLQTLTLGRLTKRQTREMVTSIVSLDTRPEKMAATRDERFEAVGSQSNPVTPSSDPSVGSRIEGLSADVIDALVARADGIPLFAEELTQAVVEAGGGASVAAIPVTLQDSLLARLDRLSGAKEVAQRAAVLGREFSYALVVATAGLDAGALQQGLARLVEAELVFVRGVPPEATYTFKHALVQEAAYESLLKRTRQQLHGRVVDVLVAQFPERAAAEPEVVARHAEVAGRIDEAIAFLQRAGEQAQNHSAHGEAIVQFRKALAVLGLQPETLERDSREVQLQLALAPSLAAARGYAHRETGVAYERARDLASVGNRRELSSALVGLANVYLNSARFKPALQLIDQALASAEATPDDWQAMAAYREKVIIDYFQGRFRSALEHGERVMKVYDPSLHHRPIVSLIGDDAGVVARSFLGWSRWQLGYPDRASAYVSEAIAAAGALDHPFSAALARFFAAAIHWMRREAGAQRHAAEELVQFAETQGFPFWLGLATALRGHAVGDPVEVNAGMAVAATTGNQVAAPLLFAFLAEAYQARCRYDDALGAIEAGLAVSAATELPYLDADLHRLKGEMTLGADAQQSFAGSEQVASECFRRAIEIAQSQEAKSFELRAATSLARLWRNQGKRAAARDLLAPLYAWFTEGFDTRDLIDAKALLDELR